MIYTTEIKTEILKRLDKHFLFSNDLLKDRITGTMQKSNETIKEYLLKVEEYRMKMKEQLIKYNKKNTKTDEVLFDLNEDVEKEVFSYNFDDTKKKTILEELNDADTANGNSIVESNNLVEEEKLYKLTEEEKEDNKTKAKPKKLSDVAEFIGDLVDTFIDLIKIIIKMTKMGLKFGQFLIAIIPIFLIIFVVISIDNDLEFL